MNELEKYYNKFNEEKRLGRRHGQVEFTTTMKYIHSCLGSKKDAKVLDVGAGTGRYSVALDKEGYDVSAVELVKYNLGILKAKKSGVKAWQGNAMNLSRFSDETFDVTLVLGPLYHLFSFADKQKVLEEAKRVTKTGGYILAAYCMNEYSVLTYAFKQNHYKECKEQKRFTEDYHTVNAPKDLYDYVRVEDIYKLSKAAGLESVKLISADGPSDFMRPVLNAMDEETFQGFLAYHLATCERPELVGAGSHTVHILKKTK